MQHDQMLTARVGKLDRANRFATFGPDDDKALSLLLRPVDRYRGTSLAMHGVFVPVLWSVAAQSTDRLPQFENSPLEATGIEIQQGGK